jgi:hypothetical protein
MMQRFRHSGVGRNPGGVPLIIEMLQDTLKLFIMGNILKSFDTVSIGLLHRSAIKSVRPETPPCSESTMNMAKSSRDTTTLT